MISTGVPARMTASLARRGVAIFDRLRGTWGTHEPEDGALAPSPAAPCAGGLGASVPAPHGRTASLGASC
jgi:hypothetical protein